MFDSVFLELRTGWRACVSDFDYMAVLRVFDSYGRLFVSLEFSSEQGAADYLLRDFPGDWIPEVNHE